MKIDEENKIIELTRTNLKALLIKLDGHPKNSLCMLSKDGWYVRAVEDEEHYFNRDRGPLHPDTESKL